MTTFTLNNSEIEYLLTPINGDGGWQRLFRDLQSKLDSDSGKITLSQEDLVKIIDKAKISNGGFQSRLKNVFKRHIPELT